MEKIISRYLAKFDDINLIADTHLDGLTVTEAQETVKGIMLDGFEEGFAAVGYSLSDTLSRSIASGVIHASLDEVIGGETTDERVARHVLNGDYSALKNVVETEFHRMYILGGDYRAEAINRERPLGKYWLTVRDMKVRDTHRYIDGITIPLDGVYYTFDGDYAPAPGLFQNVENNARCRCILGYVYL
jgi:hypothetical protein